MERRKTKGGDHDKENEEKIRERVKTREREKMQCFQTREEKSKKLGPKQKSDKINNVSGKVLYTTQKNPHHALFVLFYGQQHAKIFLLGNEFFFKPYKMIH